MRRYYDREEDVSSAIERARRYPGAFLLEFAVEPEENVLPMCIAGASVDEVIESPLTVAPSQVASM